MMIRSFIVLILFFSVFKSLAIFLTTYNLFGDEAQYWLWSKELSFGYLSKPPLIAWVIYLYTSIFGESFQALKHLPILIYFLTSFAIYAFCKRLNLDTSLSVLCSLSFLIMPAVSLSSFIVSTDVLLLLFWTLSMSSLLQIKEKPSSLNFTILGIMLGMGFLSKYAIIYFFISLFFVMFFDKKLRGVFFTNYFKIALCLISFIIVIFPNVLWNANNGWLTVGHTSDNANLKNFDPNFLRGVYFLALQIFMVGPLLFVGALINIRKINIDQNNIFLLCFSLPIIFIVLVESIIVRANANWAAVALICVLVLLIRVLKKLNVTIVVLNFAFNFIFGFLLFSLIASSSNLRIFDRIIGIKEFSNDLILQMGDNSNIVVVDRLLFSSLSYEYRNKNYNLLMPLKPGESITKHFQINSALEKNMSKNFILVGESAEIFYLENKPNIKYLTTLTPRFISSPLKIHEVSF